MVRGLLEVARCCPLYVRHRFFVVIFATDTTECLVYDENTTWGWYITLSLLWKIVAANDMQ